MRDELIERYLDTAHALKDPDWAWWDDHVSVETLIAIYKVLRSEKPHTTVRHEALELIEGLQEQWAEWSADKDLERCCCKEKKVRHCDIHGEERSYA